MKYTKEFMKEQFLPIGPEPFIEIRRVRVYHDCGGVACTPLRTCPLSTLFYALERLFSTMGITTRKVLSISIKHG